jgi:hypothetical protein
MFYLFREEIMKRIVWMAMAATLTLLSAGWGKDGLAQMTPATASNMLSDAEKADGWRLLFDGRTLLGWVYRSGPAQWSVEDGSITAVAGQGPSYIATAQEYKNFTLTVDFWTDEGHNSGIFLRGPADPMAPINQFSFYEINIADQHPSGYTTGSIVEIHKYEPAPVTAGKWNTFEIMADGRHIVVKLNGTVTADVQNGAHYSGAIALQAFGKGQVKFRNIKIKPMN